MGLYRLFPILLAGGLLSVAGCDSPAKDTPQTASPAPAAEKNSNSNHASAPISSTDTKTHASSETAAAATAEVPAAEVPATKPAQAATVAAPKPQATPAATAPQPPAEPTTALAALAVCDLESLPKPTVKQQLESHPMSIYYSTEGSLASVDQFALKELGKVGWKETKHLVTSNDQYVDRLLEKNGYYLRLTISMGGTRGEVAVTMAMLGNVDLRALPQTKDAEAQESTPVMAGHRSSMSIADAYDDLSKRMVDAGWQIVEEFHAPMADVPHYRSIHFRKNAMRVNLGLVKDPAKPAEKINIFYHAESVMPIDVPMLDHRQPLKFDTVENRAAFPWKGTRAEMVELLTKQGATFGWKLVNADDYIDEKISVLYLSFGTPVGIAARLSESKGQYSISMNRVKLPTKQDAKPDSQPSENLASSELANSEPANNAAAQKMNAEIEAQFAQTENAINKAVNDELNKALGSLSGGASKTDMQALQAQAAKLQAQLAGADDESTDSTTPSKPKVKQPAKAVPDDEEPINAEDQGIKTSQARVKLGEREMVLKYCLAYAVMEYDTPTKIVLFSDKPLLAEKLDKLRDSGESFNIYDGFGSNRPDASLELRITKNNTMMNFAADGLSISTNSSDIESTVKLKDGKVQGRVKLEKPMELRNEAITFEAAVAETVRR